MNDLIGTITVSKTSIAVTYRDPHGFGATAYSVPSIENLQDAARILAAWLDLKYEDLANECQRVSQRDQTDAELKEMIQDAMKTTFDPFGRSGHEIPFEE
jgi:hypothetical protein